MKIKEAIRFLEDIYDWKIAPDLENRVEEKVPEIVSLLKRGEKFEEKFLEIFNENKKLWQMWEEFKKKYNADYNLIELGYLDINYANQKDLDIIMEDYEQKYFPKPSDNFTEKVMEKINKEGDNETEIS